MAGIIAGQNASADEVMNAMGSLFNDTAQNLFNAYYLGFDSRLHSTGIPNLDNVYYSTFTSDDAISTNEMTYDATNDLYRVDDGATDPYVIFGESSDVGENVTNIIPIVNAKLFDDTDEITNNSFEDAITTEWAYSDDNVNFKNGSRSTTQAFSGTYSYLMGSDGNVSSGSKQEVKQTGVDLSGSEYISFYSYHTGDSDFVIDLIVDTTTIETFSAPGASWTLNKAEIPSALRSSGKDVILQVRATGTYDSSFVYLDLVQTSTLIEPTLTISNDASTFAAGTNKEIFRPGTTGQKPQVKVSFVSSATTNSYLSEGAIKYNLY